MRVLPVGLVIAAAAVACGAGGADPQQLCDAPPEGRSSPSARFVDGADGTVTDKETKLMWMRCSAGQAWSGTGCSGMATRHDWAAARQLAIDLNRRGDMFFSDWRVPLVRELATITERHCEAPRVNLSVFPDTPAGFHWTASARPAPADAGSAYALSFGSEGVALQSKVEALYVRLVRSSH